MSTTNPIIQEVINELMFIAISQPESLAVNVSYRSKLDYICVNVMPASFDLNPSDDKTTELERYKAAVLLNVDMPLYIPDALQRLVDTKERLLQLIAANLEVAA